MRITIAGKNWENTKGIEALSFRCWNCERDVAGNLGFQTDAKTDGNSGKHRIYICPRCNVPNYAHNRQYFFPAPPIGEKVEHVPEVVNNLFNEARQCASIGCYTACVMALRKVLMNVAVDHGAKAGESFASYVQFLKDQGFLPPKTEASVKHIKDKGNAANHQIQKIDSEEAMLTLKFTTALLRNVYELPESIKIVDKAAGT